MNHQAIYDTHPAVTSVVDDIPKDAEGNLVVVDEALVTAESIRLDAVDSQALIKREARLYLASTDWYASRKAEAGTEIPADILALRQQARLDASS